MLEHEVAVKICGVTKIDDSFACAAAGADLIGLNFSPRSLRCIGPATARQIVHAVRAEFPVIKLVGIFLDQELALIQKVAADLALDAVQLHGAETPEYLRALSSCLISSGQGRPFVVAGGADPGSPGALPRQPPLGSTPSATTFVIKALRMRDATSAARALDYRCDAILLDTWDRATPGGTGRTFPWSIAAALRPQVRRLILAGGLTSANVKEAIRTVQPFAVDVCSGVESAPGRKDEKKVRAFVEAVRAADTAR